MLSKAAILTCVKWSVYIQYILIIERDDLHEGFYLT